MSFNAQARQEKLYDIASGLIAKNAYLSALDSAIAYRNAYYKKLTVKGIRTKPISIDMDVVLFSSFLGEEYLVPGRDLKTALTVGNYRFKPAADYILNQATTRQVVIINEAHQVPKHRLLTMNLLEALYKIGFRYLCVEALDDDSTLLNFGYPTINSGFYTAEPGMGNLIKKAIKLGYKVVPYESDDDTDDNPKYPTYAQNIREVNQANNINKILIKDPGAKILVHAGHGHIWERGTNLIYMAEYFKNLAHIDPLTINQSVNNLREFSILLDHSADRVENDLPYVVLDTQFNPVVSTEDKIGDYDLLVAWPTPKRVFNRFDYQLAKNGTSIVKIKLANSDAHNLLQIMSTKPGDDIPVDQFLVKKGVGEYATALEPGEYNIQLVDSMGKVIWKRSIKSISQRNNDD
ncbi:hypothetical protein [Pedobacter duraquae]|nr:hypothetical protein [Pedobacter duraquae]